MSLAEFLLARIAEDEAAARDPQWLALEYGVDSFGRDAFRTRVLAECEAKRRIVELQAANDDDRHLPGFYYKAQMIERILRALALPYADHPDYRQEWRP